MNLFIEILLSDDNDYKRKEQPKRLEWPLPLSLVEK